MQKLQEHSPFFIELLVLIEITYKLTIYDHNPLKNFATLKFWLICQNV